MSVSFEWYTHIPRGHGFGYWETVTVTVTELKGDVEETARLSISCKDRAVCWGLFMRPVFDVFGDGPKKQTVRMRYDISVELYNLIKGAMSGA